MRLHILALAVLALVLAAGSAEAKGLRTHVVAEGHTLGKIAKRYNVSIDAICTANGIKRNKPIQKNRRRVRRVYLLTGAQDGVVEGTKQVLRKLRRAGVPVRIFIPKNMGHELPLHRKGWLYAAALKWLERGGRVPTTEVITRSRKTASR